ncbi:hypothetical protein SANTM175S_07577 [Streptomyces antimycoticus]
MSLISVSRWSESGAANNPCHTSAGLSARAPTASDTAAAITRTATSVPRPTTRRRRAFVVPQVKGRSIAVVPMSQYVIPLASGAADSVGDRPGPVGGEQITGR